MVALKVSRAYVTFGLGSLGRRAEVQAEEGLLRGGGAERVSATTRTLHSGARWERYGLRR